MLGCHSHFRCECRSPGGTLPGPVEYNSHSDRVMGACWGTKEEIRGKHAAHGGALGISFQLHSLLLLGASDPAWAPPLSSTLPPSCDHKAKPLLLYMPCCWSCRADVDKAAEKRELGDGCQEAGRQYLRKFQIWAGWLLRSRPLDEPSVLSLALRVLQLANYLPLKFLGAACPGGLTLLLLLVEEVSCQMKERHRVQRAGQMREQIPGTGPGLTLHCHPYP